MGRYQSKSIITNSIRALVVALFLTTDATQAIKTNAGIMRVDLERELVQRPEVLSTEDEEQQMISGGVDIDNLSYSQLRNIQNFHIRQSFAQVESKLDNPEKVIEIENVEIDDNQSNRKYQAPISDENVLMGADVQMKTSVFATQLVSETGAKDEDVGGQMQLQVPLLSRNDAVYQGKVYMGTPISQPATVVFDTGSEYLTITSNLCNDKTSGNIKFKRWDPSRQAFVRRRGLGTGQRCSTMAYDIHKSKSQKMMSKASSKLTYGSAKTQGFIWQDYTCLNPLPAGLTKATLPAALKKEKCALFEFLALYQATGLGRGSDGILGLSPHKDRRKNKLHYLWSLKNNGIIDHAIVSFSISSRDMHQSPYALFGGYNSSQIIDGAKGLKSFKNYKNWLGTWALEAEGMTYGNGTVLQQANGRTYPAIIDTGSSQLSIPPHVFDKLRAEWQKALPDLDCVRDKTFCTVPRGCNQIVDKLQPVTFQFSNYMFQMAPMQYLFKSGPNKCYFVIHKCKLPGKNAFLYLVGDVFLRHFYSVYDFDKDQLGLGINIHSKGKANMWKAGTKPTTQLDLSTAADDEDQKDERDDDEQQVYYSRQQNDPWDVDEDELLIKQKLRQLK